MNGLERLMLRETDRQTETGRQTDRQTDRDKDRQTETEADRQTDRDRAREKTRHDIILYTKATDKHACFLHPALAQRRDRYISNYT